MKIIKTEKFKKVAQGVNPLDGKTNQQARTLVNNRIIPHDLIKGFFSDQAWQGVNQVWTALDNAGLDWNVTGSQYYPPGTVPPEGKIWKFEIRFTNKTGKPTVLYGTVTAAGAGSVQDPLERYDITAYV